MITIYTTKTCAYCPMVKRYFKAKNVEYQEVDVTDDMEARNKLFDLTKMMTVPVSTKGDKFVVGYQPALLAKLAA